MEQVSRGGVRSDISIDLDTLGAYLHKKYPDRKHIDAESVSELIEEISSHSRYKTIAELDEVLTAGHEGALLYEKEYPPGYTGRFADVSIVRVALAIADRDYSLSYWPDMDPTYEPFKQPKK